MASVATKAVSELRLELPVTIASLLKGNILNRQVAASGWVKSVRRQKSVSFLELSDGSSSQNLQVILDKKVDLSKYYSEKRCTSEMIYFRVITGSSVKLAGTLKASPGQGQSLELIADDISLLGECPPDVSTLVCILYYNA